MTDLIMNFSKCSILKDKIEMLKYHVCHIKKKKKRENLLFTTFIKNCDFEF